MVALAALVAACGSDSVSKGSTPCSFDDDCPLGQVCGHEGICITAACDFCTDDQICYVTPENPEGSCSRKECYGPEDCTDGKVCVGGLCTADQECTNDTDCGDSEICNLANQCVPDTSTECDDSTDCEDGQICDENNECVDEPCTADSCGDNQQCNTDTGECEDLPSCDDVVCEDNERCNPSTGECVRDCVSDAEMCGANEVCDQATGQCVVNNCPGQDPNQCAGATPYWNQSFCACVACLDDTHCSGGRTCNSNGQCAAGCQTPCDPSTPGQCGGSTPYCVSECCSECVGAADCPNGKVCLDGFCGDPPDCSLDPSVCPAGYECNNGNCDPPQTGGSCDPSTGQGCPDGTMCDPMTGTCQSLGGDLGCGFCNPDCTCDGGLTCDGMFCVGCTLSVADLFSGNLAGNCPAGYSFCLDVESGGGTGYCM